MGARFPTSNRALKTGGYKPVHPTFFTSAAMKDKPDNFFSLQWWPRSNLTVFFHHDGCRNET
jgi:hypothetical protein